MSQPGVDEDSSLQQAAAPTPTAALSEHHHNPLHHWGEMHGKNRRENKNTIESPNCNFQLPVLAGNSRNRVTKHLL